MDTIGDTLPRRTPPPRPALHPKATLLSILKHLKESDDPSSASDRGLLSVESPRPRVTSSSVKHHRSYTPPKRVQVPISTLSGTTSPLQRQLLFHRQQKHKPPSMIQINPTPSPYPEDDSSMDETTMLHRRLLHAATTFRTQRHGTTTLDSRHTITVPLRRAVPPSDTRQA